MGYLADSTIWKYKTKNVWHSTLCEVPDRTSRLRMRRGSERSTYLKDLSCPKYYFNGTKSYTAFFVCLEH